MPVPAVPSFERAAQARLLRLARGFPVIVLIGPRQSGKTTLVRSAFARHAYVSLEDLDVRANAVADPRGFIARFGGEAHGVVIDEVQHAPQLLSYLQTTVDAGRAMGRFVLTGSQNLLLSSHVSQTLAGRAAYLELLPLATIEAPERTQRMSLDELLTTGLYPALYDRPIDAADWHASYLATYVERDVRQLSRVADLLQFQRFMRLMAARCGQLLNLSAVGSDLGIAQTTVRDWLAVLEASYIVFRLPPYHTNFGKRLVKTPKLYFHDVGLAAHLLGLTQPQAMNSSPMRGALFENLLITEYLKHCRNLGLNHGLYFWRDNIGNEVDLLVERGGTLWPIEFKSGATFHREWLGPLHTWARHAAGAQRGEAMLISAAPGSQWVDGVMAANWRDAVGILGEELQSSPAQFQ